MELKSPETPHPREPGHMPWPPPQKCGNLDTSNPNLTQPCGWGGGPGVVALVTRELSVPVGPLHVELAHDHRSPGIPCHTQVWGPRRRASKCN